MNIEKNLLGLFMRLYVKLFRRSSSSQCLVKMTLDIQVLATDDQNYVYFELVKCQNDNLAFDMLSLLRTVLLQIRLLRVRSHQISFLRIKLLKITQRQVSTLSFSSIFITVFFIFYSYFHFDKRVRIWQEWGVKPVFFTV